MIIQLCVPDVRQPDIGRGFYVFPDLDRPTHSVDYALAGPFESAIPARLWILQRLEAGLTETQRAIWVKLAPRLSADLGLELFLLEWIAKGKTLERLLRYVPQRGGIDRRMLAAGDSEAA